MDLRVAVYQFPTSTDPEANANRILLAMENSVDRKADILVLPECALTGYFPAKDLDYTLVKRLLAGLRRKCGEMRLGLVVGVTVRERDGLYNRAYLISKSGRNLGHYDKVALTSWGDVKVFQPGQHIEAFSFERIKVGIQICYDMRYPENWRILRSQGVRIVFLLANASKGDLWKRPVLTGTLSCRASENGIFVVAANDSSAPQMMVSSAHDPDGRLIAVAKPDTEQLMVASLDLSPDREWFGDKVWNDRPVHAWKGRL